MPNIRIRVLVHTIGGYYLDWQKEDGSGNPSFKVNFEYNFNTNTIKFMKGNFD